MEEKQQQNQLEQQNLEQKSDEIQELEKLEEDVKFMAQKIADFRQTLPDHLKNTLASFISAQRPANLTRPDDDSDPGTSNNPNPDARTPLVDSEGRVKILTEEDQMQTEKVEMIKQKISGNASAMPLLVKRMKDCMSRIDKLDSFKKDIIHPAFARKRTS